MNGYLLSVNPAAVVVENGIYPRITVPAADPEKRYSVVPIPDRVSAHDQGKDNITPHRDSGIAMANDIATRYVRHGIFASADPRPSTEQLEQMLAVFANICVETVQLADSRWRDTKNLRQINDADRNAARFLGKIFEWTDQIAQDSQPCPECKELVKIGARKCRFCGSRIGDEEPPPMKTPQMPRPPARA